MLMDVQHAQRGQPVFRHGVSKWRLDLFIYFFFFIIIIFRYAIAYLRTGSYAPAQNIFVSETVNSVAPNYSEFLFEALRTLLILSYTRILTAAFLKNKVKESSQNSCIF